MRFLKRYGWSAGFLALMGLSLVAQAQPRPGAENRKEIREDKKELREDRKEIREDRKEIREDKKDGDKKELREDRKELREDKKELREDRKELLEDLRKNRQERRREHIQKLKERWGDAMGRPAVRAELRTHARRMARLNHMRRLADSAGKTELVTRIDKVIERERNRHQAAMDRLKSEGAKP